MPVLPKNATNWMQGKEWGISTGREPVDGTFTTNSNYELYLNIHDYHHTWNISLNQKWFALIFFTYKIVLLLSKIPCKIYLNSQIDHAPFSQNKKPIGCLMKFYDHYIHIRCVHIDFIECLSFYFFHFRAYNFDLSVSYYSCSLCFYANSLWNTILLRCFIYQRANILGFLYLMCNALVANLFASKTKSTFWALARNLGMHILVLLSTL